MAYARDRLPRLHSPGALADLLTGFSRDAATVAGQLADVTGLRRRGVRSRPGRHHIEVRGVAQPDGELLARRVERALARVPGVAWARVNAPSGRVVVAVEPPEPRLRDLIATVAEVERTDGTRAEPENGDIQPHPPEEGPRTGKALSTLAADALGLTLSAATRILPFTRAPAEVAGAIGIVDLHPRLHALANRGLRGDHRADSLLPLAAVIAQGLAGGWAGIVLDGAQRVLQWREARAQLAAWNKAEPELTGTPERAAAPPLVVERPRAKPYGSAERYAERAITAGALAAGAAVPVIGARRAAALGLAALPRAAYTGRESFAATLGRMLAGQGVIAMDRAVLRDLDRMDTLLLDPAVLHSGHGALTELEPLPGAPAEEVAVRAFALFDPAEPDALRKADGWSLGPVDQLSLTGRKASSRTLRRLGAGGATVLGLAEGRTLAAVIRVEPEPAPGLDLLAVSARRAGLRLLVATGDGRQEEHDDRYPFADGLVPGAGRLVASIRDLQADGAMVMLVSDHQRALAAADCGIGVWRRGENPPWGAHLLVGDGLPAAALVVEAAGRARAVARQCVTLAGAGSGLA
ncbi:MAG TPA: heavy-metal-associated domain-containing protein, partial [Micromonospora sp.]